MTFYPVLLALALVVASEPPNANFCEQNTIEIETALGPRSISVEIADDTKERARGLSGRETLDVGSGMLFLYDTPHHALFWMLETKIPLDMIFIKTDGYILAIMEHVQPETYWPISGGRNVIAVLEMNAGEAKRYNLKIGDHIRHSAFGNLCG